MTEMVERVARGVTEELLRQRISSSFGRNLEGINPPLDVPAIARAAIAAMREPTEAMTAAGAARTSDLLQADTSTGYVVLETFTAMIDAALGAQP